MKPLRILVVDDEEAMRESLCAWLEKEGHEGRMADSAARAMEALAAEPFDLILMDIKMPGVDGIELLRRVKVEHPDILVVMVTAYGSIESAVAAMKMGANDYLLKPFDPEHLMLLIEKLGRQKALLNDYRALQARLAAHESMAFDKMVGASPAMREVFHRIEEVAPTDAPVLITGETGTGKELVARAIHSRSRRRQGPFIAINCGAVQENLLESELFGHERGAFTGAVRARLGRLEMADQGTLFLDEVGEISQQMQINLLRALETRRFIRVGGTRELESDFRLISATHRDLGDLRAEGRMRSDFYYRVAVIGIPVPPLRDRGDDTALLARHFLDAFSTEMNKAALELSPAAYRLLADYRWPGNVRELRNVIERAVVVSRGIVIDVTDLTFLAGNGDEASPSEGTLEDMEARHIAEVLAREDWNTSRAARKLGIHRGTLSRKIKKHGLVRPQAPAGP